MKKAYKFLQSQFGYIGNLINWFLLLVTRENLKCYVKKDREKKELRIIGNGPSLIIDKVIDKDPNIEYCMVNHACKTKEFQTIKPNIYIVADPGFILNTYLDVVRESWKELKKVNWNMEIYVPFYLLDKALENLKGSKLKVYGYHSAPLKIWNKVSFAFYDLNIAIPGAGNVMVPSIYIGILKGFSTIRLYGSDHSWTEQLRVNEKNQVCIKDVHYYDNGLVKLKPWNDETGKPFSMKIILKKFSEVFEQYEILEQYARSRNVSIINMCPESFIDSFEKQCV